MDAFYVYCLALFIVFYVISCQFIQKLQNLPPSPFPSLPFIGHLYLLKTPFHRALSKISKKYGPVLYLQFGSRPVVLVSSPSLAEECFTKNDIIFANRPTLLAGKYFGYNYTSMAWAPYSDHWRNLRRISSLEVLSSHRLQTLSKIRVSEVRSLIKRLNRVSRECSEEGIDMKSALFDLTFNIMTRMITGKRYRGENVDNSNEAKVFQDIATETSRAVARANILDFLPFMRWFGFKDVEKTMVNVQEKRDKFIQNIIEEHRRKKTDDPSGDSRGDRTIIEVLLGMQISEPEYYKDETVRNLMLVLLQAGSDTTASTLEWAFSHLLDNPDVFKKAQAEIDDQVGQGRLIEESDLGEIPYIRCIVNETLRLHPAAPLLMPHKSSEECNIGGFRVPGGTILLVNVWDIQRNPKTWEDPEKFKPERFYGFEAGKEGLSFFPFGSGRRGCPGENLAMRVVGFALSSLIQCFDWERVGDEIDMAEATGTTAPKLQPLMARCYPRQITTNLVSQP